MNQCLSRSLRINRGQEIQQILTQGQKYTGTHLILYVSKSTPEPTLRAGFLSPRRIGNAVKRNRVRRWMREIFRKHRQELKGSVQMIIMGRTSAARAGYQGLRDDFFGLCRKACLLQERDK